MKVTIAAPAKVNLSLRVGGLEPSGFHHLTTLFCALELSDTVVLRSGRPGAAALDVDYAPPLQTLPALGPAEDNLAARAAADFADRAGLDGLPRIRLVKRIPAGGGLGGGSSDAAAVLRAMRRLHPRRLDRTALLEIARGLGSDVPFFLLGTPLARAEGRGDLVTPLPPLPQRPVVVVLPPFPVSTAAAYGWLDEDRAAGRAPAPEDERVRAHVADEAGAGSRGEAGIRGEGEGAPATLHWDAVAERAVNDFEDPVFARHPWLERLRDALQSRGARPALLAGSGSTVFGVFDGAGAAAQAAAEIRQENSDVRVLVTRTRAR